MASKIGLMADGTFVLDNSIRSAFHKCELSWWLTYGVWRATSEVNKDLFCGTCIHSAVARYYRGELPESVMAKFDEEYGGWARGVVPPEDNKSWQNARNALWVWLSRREDGCIYKPVENLIESWFEFPLDEHGEFIYCGRIDALVEGDLGMALEETKTTGFADNRWVEQWHMDDQITGYFAGLREDPQWNIDIPYVYVNCIEMAKTPVEMNRKCRTHGVKYQDCWMQHNRSGIYGPYIRQPEQIAAWRRRTLNDARRMKELLVNYGEIEQIGDIHATGMSYAKGNCGWCSWRPFCLSGMTVEKALANSIEKFWDPRSIQGE